MAIEAGRHLKSTDVAGGLHGPGWACLLYLDAGFRHIEMEGVSFPLFTIDLIDKFKKGKKLAYPLAGIHARTGQLQGESWRLNTALDLVKMSIAEPLLLDLTYEFDTQVLPALQKLGTPGQRKYVLVHESELVDSATVERYVEVFSRSENQEIDLFIENSPIRGAHQRAFERVTELREAGLEHVEYVADTVHYFRGLDIDFRDMGVLATHWSRMLTWLDETSPALLHHSEGLDSGDSLDMEQLQSERVMMRDLGDCLKEKGIIFETENQHGAFGAEFEEEVERQKGLGNFYVQAGLISEKHFTG